MKNNKTVVTNEAVFKRNVESTCHFEDALALLRRVARENHTEYMNPDGVDWKGVDEALTTALGLVLARYNKEEGK